RSRLAAAACSTHHSCPSRRSSDLLPCANLALLIGLSWNWLTGFKSHEFIQTVLVNQFMALKDCTFRAELNYTGFATMQGDFSILPLQGETDSFSDDEPAERDQND